MLAMGCIALVTSFAPFIAVYHVPSIIKLYIPATLTRKANLAGAFIAICLIAHAHRIVTMMRLLTLRTP